MGRSAVQKHLAETEEQIATGQHQVAQQRELIAELEADGRSAAHAKYLLAGLELLQAARRDSPRLAYEAARQKLRGEVSVLAFGLRAAIDES